MPGYYGGGLSSIKLGFGLCGGTARLLPSGLREQLDDGQSDDSSTMKIEQVYKVRIVSGSEGVSRCKRMTISYSIQAQRRHLGLSLVRAEKAMVSSQVKITTEMRRQ